MQSCHATKVGLETKPTPAATQKKRNRWRRKRFASNYRNHYQTLPIIYFVYSWSASNNIRATEYNFYSKYHKHASAFSLQIVCCRFIYLYEENANAADRQLEQFARMSGKPKSHDDRSSTANQHNSSGRFRSHPA